MNPDLKAMLETALSLDDDKRVQLIDLLEASFSPEYLEEAERAWIEKANRRGDQIERREAEMILDEQVSREVRRILDEIHV